MARGSSNLAGGSKPAVGVADIKASKQRGASHRPEDVAGAKGAALQITELVAEETMSADEMIACLGSCRARWEIAAMIKALSLRPWLNTPAENKRPVAETGSRP